jgi:hypothetical protein
VADIGVAVCPALSHGSLLRVPHVSGSVVALAGHASVHPLQYLTAQFTQN